MAFLLMLLATLGVSPGTASPSPRPALADLPIGALPRIGYVEHQAWVAPDGRRTRLPLRYGVSGIVPYAGGFLVSDDRYFEGSVGLWFVTGAEARDLPGCSSGPPRQADGWVWWMTAHCPESLDIVRAEIHRARPDGSDQWVRTLRAGPRENLLMTTAAVLDRAAPLRRWVREDAIHRLAVVDQWGWTAVVRVDDTGRRELATTPVRHVRGPAPYVLGPGR
jgi:hypothetical protein